MLNEELIKLIETWGFPLQITEEGTEFLTFTVQKDDLHEFCRKLKSDPDTHFDFLYCVTGMDWGNELGVIYHLASIDLKHEIVVKVMTADRETPELDTVCDIWRTAEFHEMEVYDFFGIRFKGHPSLKRLFLTPDWDGYPLRKDYVDEANMVIK
jgi:NADH:ubiquinone oxidoreductase subunit C